MEAVDPLYAVINIDMLHSDGFVYPNSFFLSKPFFFGIKPDWNVMCSKSLERVKNPISSFWLLSNDTKPTCCNPFLSWNYFFFSSAKAQNADFFSCFTRRREPKQSAGPSHLDLCGSSLFQVAASDKLWHVTNASNKKKNRKKKEKRAASWLISWQDEAVTPWCVCLDDCEDGGGLTKD